MPDAKPSKRFPRIDVSQIKPGDKWTIAQQEEVLGAKFGTKEFSFKLMQLKRYIETATARSGLRLHCWMVKNELVFGEFGPDQMGYALKRNKRAHRITRRSLKILGDVQDDKLTDEQSKQKAAHEMRIGTEILLAQGVSVKRLVSAKTSEKQDEIRKLLGRSPKIG